SLQAKEPRHFLLFFKKSKVISFLQKNFKSKLASLKNFPPKLKVFFEKIEKFILNLKKLSAKKDLLTFLGYLCVFSALVCFIILTSPLMATNLVLGIKSYHGKINPQIYNDASLLKSNSLLTEIFYLQIPKINLFSPVITNIDAADETAYKKALDQGIAHAAGTALPGEGKMIFLFAHDVDFSFDLSRYNALFYNLKDLEAKDPLTLFYDNKEYQYEVLKKLITDPSDTSALEEYKNQDVLIMQTCYPPGTTWKRLLVVAGRIEG
ncbi:sortase, partial [Candidatus Beckwithbacteria bacterium]|nr:sortase [Candidatus Beckwithbacteria bacterium]